MIRMISTGWSLQHETCSTVDMKDAVINTGRTGRVDVTMKLQQSMGCLSSKHFLFISLVKVLVMFTRRKLELID